MIFRIEFLTSSCNSIFVTELQWNLYLQWDFWTILSYTNVLYVFVIQLRDCKYENNVLFYSWVINLWIVNSWILKITGFWYSIIIIITWLIFHPHYLNTYLYNNFTHRNSTDDYNNINKILARFKRLKDPNDTKLNSYSICRIWISTRTW